MLHIFVSRFTPKEKQNNINQPCFFSLSLTSSVETVPNVCRTFKTKKMILFFEPRYQVLPPHAPPVP